MSAVEIRVKHKRAKLFWVKQKVDSLHCLLFYVSLYGCMTELELFLTRIFPQLACFRKCGTQTVLQEMILDFFKKSCYWD